MSCSVRTHPYRKPKNHRVPVPRWTLSLPESVEHVYTLYIGIQQHSDEDETKKATTRAIDACQQWLAQDNGPATYESFTVLDNIYAKNIAVWVCYWSDASRYQSSIASLSLPSIQASLPESSRSSIGLWRESFTTNISRLETNYSGLDYLPGLAKLPEAETVEHTLSAYWGAARDRIPDSAHDLFLRLEHQDMMKSDVVKNGLGKHLLGTNHSNLVHIRSGQWWENCSQIESDAYTQNLEPILRSGLHYLQFNPQDTGSIAVRYLQNNSSLHDPNAVQSKESCGAGFFRNLEDLEKWAHTHPSHLKIYKGAMSHYKEFGDQRRFRTWHEVSVIEEGKAEFEYVNCELEPGVKEGIRWVRSSEVRL
jgi:hypothetical protein